MKSHKIQNGSQKNSQSCVPLNGLAHIHSEGKTKQKLQFGKKPANMFNDKTTGGIVNLNIS